jgi:hypothetical protein
MLDADVLSRTARAFANEKGRPDLGRLPQMVAALLVRSRLAAPLRIVSGSRANRKLAPEES